MQNAEFMKKMIATIIKYNMIEKNDRVVVGLSGGADSMALFHALLSLREEYGLTVSAVHVNHGLRGAEAARDEQFVRETCAAHGVLLSVFRFDIRAVAKEKGVTIEEAGRLMRYEAFEKTRGSHAADKIALAHHLNDQAETVLMRIIRGTGTKGLAGIPAVRGNIIRPLYDFTREEIEQFIAENNLAHVTDSTNYEDAYARNKLRLKLLPYLKEEMNPNIVKTLARLAQVSSEENDYIEAMAEALYRKCLIPGEGGGLFISELKKAPAALQKRVLRKACLQAAASIKDISFDHMNDLLKLADNQSGRQLRLPNGLTVYNSFGALFFSKEESTAERFFYALPIEPNGAAAPVFIRETGFYITVAADEIKCFRNFNNVCTKRFDYDRIIGTLSLRTPRPGDRIALGGGSKKIARYFTDEKTPLWERKKAPLIADDAAVLWIIGGKTSKKHEAGGDTRRAVTIQLWEEKE